MTPPAPLGLHPDRLLPPEPGVRAIARRLYETVRALPTDKAAEETINPDAAMVTTYAELRGSIPRLVAGLDAVASLLAAHPPSRPTTNVRNR